ncbi:PKD domain-containing protein [Spirosoma endbachense]|uniref:PKD domain-containing protein n=1 Tax=Spirosoma endbachense TaxID=2666025 RepID=A0A6P1VV77_9BACT|nr:PKD domain-containing protein [Spirosoma endbachense]QHV95657.1 PKD domain-containing protein [Spirosoma endbachense]
MKSLFTLALLFEVVLLIFSCGQGNSPTPATPTSDLVANFEFTGGDCTAPCEVSFTQKATGSITSYLWDFGDKTTTSAEVNPKHTYQQGGTFTVTLTVSGPGGTSQPKAQSLTIKTGTTTGIPAKVWDKTFGGTDDDAIRAMVATSDGGFLLGGYSRSGQNGNRSAPNLGKTDMWVVKVDGSGNKVWDKAFGGSNDDVLTSILATSDGGFLLGGNSKSDQDGNKSTPKQGGGSSDIGDMWVVKIDGSGNKVWDKAFGSNDSDGISAMVATSDGGFLLGGYSDSDQTGSKSAPKRGGTDMWVVKIDGGGNKIWDKTFGGADSDYLNSMVATSDGGFLLGGYSRSSQDGNKSDANRGQEDYWVVKIDGSGNKVWDKTFGGSDTDYLNSVATTSDGGFLLGGYSRSSQDGNKSDANRGQEDYWVVKIDGSGNKIWDKTFGGSSGDNLRAMAATSDGGFLLGGASGSGQTGNKSAPYQGAYDYWVVKINGSGSKVWDKTFGGSSNDMMYSLLATSDGGFLFGGNSNSDQSGDKSDPNRGNTVLKVNDDMWVVKAK